MEATIINIFSVKNSWTLWKGRLHLLEDPVGQEYHFLPLDQLDPGKKENSKG